MHLQLLSECDESQRPALSRATSVSVLLVLCMMSCGCLNRTSTSAPSDEDTVVSYLQSVTSLAKQLKLKFDDKSNGAVISGLVQSGGLNSDDRIKASLEEVISYQEAVRAIPTDSRKRLYQLHDELVGQTEPSASAD